MTDAREIASKLTEAQRAAHKWMLDHGGDAAIVRCNGGGRILLAQGDTGPFTFGTCNALIAAGLAEYVEQNGRKVRFRLAVRAILEETGK